MAEQCYDAFQRCDAANVYGRISMWIKAALEGILGQSRHRETRGKATRNTPLMPGQHREALPEVGH